MSPLIEELDDIDYINGTVFDAEKFAYGENFNARYRSGGGVNCHQRR